MSGKGDDRRPATVGEKEFATNWDRIFARQMDEAHKASADVFLHGIGAYTVTDDGIKHVPYEDLMGSGVTGSISGSNPEGPRSSLGSPAIYINADTGE